MVSIKSVGLGVATVLVVGGVWYGVSQHHATGKVQPLTQTVKPQSDTSKVSLLKTPSAKLAGSVLTDDVRKKLSTNNVTYNDAGAFILNDNKTDLDAGISSQTYVQLSNVDNMGRPQVANAWLNNGSRQYRDRKETGNDKKISPVGWQQAYLAPSKPIYNRGHLIGYAIAGNVKGFDASEANKKNIVTQTAWANQASNGNDKNTGQNYYENKVRKALDQKKQVRYRVTPIYDQSNLVPAGNRLEAKSKDNSLEFDVFVPNVQSGAVINYTTGVVTVGNDVV